MDEVKHLIEDLITDRDWDQRLATIRHVEKCGISDAQFKKCIDILLIDEDSEIRYGAAQLLGIVKNRSSTPFLMQVLENDEDEYVRMKAAQVLSKFNDPCALQSLIKALNEEKKCNVLSSVAEALANLGFPSLNDEQKMLCLLLRNRSDELAAFGDRALPLLERGVEGVVLKVQLDSVAVLEKIQSKKTEPILIKALKCKNPHARFLAITSLGNSGSSKAIPALLEQLNHDEKDVRELSMETIGKIVKQNPESPEAIDSIPAFIGLLRSDQSLWKEISTIALSSIGIPAVPALIDSLKNEFLAKQTFYILNVIVSKCESRDKLVELKDIFEDAYESMMKNDKRDLIQIGYKIALLKKKIAQKHNELSKDKEILLDDKPKPPKKGTLYRKLGTGNDKRSALRRSLNG
jgi:HEAT repeat protein